MPVHFNSFIADKKIDLKKKVFADIVTKYTEEADDVFVTDDKKKIHMTSFIKNTKTNENIGKVIITLVVREDSIELVDTDITLINPNKVELFFEEKLEQSSESNEYYIVRDLDDERHFDIETVNRYCIDGELEDKAFNVSLSAFPFQLEVFENIDDLNESLGMNKEIDIPGIGKKVIGMDPRMMSDGRIMTDSDEPSSFIIGKVEDYIEVETDIADNILQFGIIKLETAVGVIPVAVHKDNFDLSKIKKDSLVGMVVDLKADLKQ